MADAVGSLSFIDEHRVDVAAAPDAVWRALGRSLRGQRRGHGYAVLVGAVPSRLDGDPLEVGSTIPGFAVREAVPAERLVLAGRHRFSVYELVFELLADGPATILTARTLADFPGVAGRAYRAAVIGSGAHRVLLRRWLRRIARAAERPGRDG